MVKRGLRLIYCIALFYTPIAYAGKFLPSIELLEYLADLENDDGQWIDPLKMNDLANNKIDEPTEEKGNE